MKRLNKRAAEESKIDITPMLDVVFIMLIFFIVTATFVKESGTKVNKPDAVTAVQRPNASILLAINENDEVWIDRKQVDPRAVKVNVNRLRAENPEGEVVIQADANASAEILFKVVDALKEAGIAVPPVATLNQ